MARFATLRLLGSTLWCVWSLTAAAHAEELRLSNGLRVVLAPDPSASNVAIVMGYQVGSGHDPQHYRGLAHLVEHLTFRGSRHLRAEQGTEMIEASGGGSNAFTTPDQTLYVAVLPRAALPLGLWLERERMAFALDGIDQNALDLERKIVRNEMAERTGQLGWRLFMQRQRSLYGLGHAYASEDDALLSDISAVTLPGVQWFFQSHYRPDNATLVVVGAFDAQAARPLIESYFGPIENPKQRQAMQPLAAPKQCGVHRVHVGHHFLLGRELIVTWTLQRPKTAQERMSMRALQYLLNARLHDELVRGSYEAASVSVALEHRQSHSLLNVGVKLHEVAKPEKVEARLTKAAVELAAQPLPQEALRALRGELTTAAVLAREDVLSRAMAIATTFDTIQDADDARALDAASIQRVAAQLTAARLTLIAEPSDAVGDGTGILDEEDPCR